jgi:hypothetical protein
MSSPFEEPNPFQNPFADTRTPSAWEAFVERTKGERQQRRRALVAMVLNLAGVALSTSVAVSIGADNGEFFLVFFPALKHAALIGFCGGGLFVVLGVLGTSGGLVHVLPGLFRSSSAPKPKGAPLFPLSLASAIWGIFPFTMIGAFVGADSSGEALLAPDMFLRALLGGIVGMLPVGLWWLYLRHRAGKSIRVVAAVLVFGLFLTCLAGLLAFRSGLLQPGRD